MYMFHDSPEGQTHYDEAAEAKARLITPPIHHAFIPSPTGGRECQVCGIEDENRHLWGCHDHGIVGNGAFNCGQCREMKTRETATQLPDAH